MQIGMIPSEVEAITLLLMIVVSIATIRYGFERYYELLRIEENAHFRLDNTKRKVSPLLRVPLNAWRTIFIIAYFLLMAWLLANSGATVPPVIFGHIVVFGGAIIALYAHLQSLRDHRERELKLDQEKAEAFRKAELAAEAAKPPPPIVPPPTWKETLGITNDRRMEHMHVVAGTGHGKTQAFQHFIVDDLEAVKRDEASIIVLDSQEQMISTISRLRYFAPGEVLDGKLIVIDPKDIEHPIALSMFASKQNADPLERERLLNSSAALLSYVFQGLLGSQLTPYQTTLLGFVIRFCLVIPNATIHTMKDVLVDFTSFSRYIDRLDPVAQGFFLTQYASTQYRQSRQELASKLYGVLNNTTFSRMFSSPVSKLDLFSEMNAGKVILIDTSKGFLHGASPLLGRFFIAMVLQATQERTNAKKLPTYFYIDEAHEYFDSNVTTMLEQARKSKVGLILAHQQLGQLKEIRDSVLANTSIRLVGGVSYDDDAVLSKMMGVMPGAITGLHPFTFLGRAKGGYAVTVSVLPGRMEELPRMTDEEWRQVRDDIRRRYAIDTSVMPVYAEPEPVYLQAAEERAEISDDDPSKPVKW